MTVDDPTLSSTGGALTTFPLFPKLPVSLRARILSYAAPGPRTRFLELFGYEAPTYTPKIRYIPPLPTFFHVSRETRHFSICHEGGSLIHFFAREIEGRKFYFNFANDIVFLSSRFTPAGKSTETFRLRELSTLLAPPFLSRLRRVVVTYSGRDDYAAIGGVVRPYVCLETLYVAMSDWWSERGVRTRLRNGKPPAGYVAWSVERVMREADAEEADDEGESDGENEGKMQVRLRRRVVECELRLDEEVQGVLQS